MKELKFIHITKNAGTSIEEIGRENKKWWGKYNKEYGWWHGIFPKKSKELKNKYDWFMIVRNPYDRILSEYYCKWGGVGKNKCNNSKETFNKFLINKIKKRSRRGGHYTEQYKYLDEDYNINIIKFENLEYEFNELMKKYKLNIKFNKHINKSNNKEFKISDFSEDLIELINKVYEDDFSKFGYDMIK
jgi:hypothetical protein